MQQPNILLIMADQLAGPALPFYGHPIVQTPHLARLAEQAVVFDSAYCNSPLCAPSRASMMTGQLPSRIGVYDNAAELPAAMPTFAHYLRAAGYATSLVGKMHFVGPDQLHGFEERLTTDIYPADFGWTPNWEAPTERLSWYHNMFSVAQAGLCVTTNQLDFDEEVAFHAERKIYELARRDRGQPFLLLASFTHPHDPYAIPRRYWDRYDHAQIPPPTVPPIPHGELDPHSRRIAAMCAWDELPLSEEQVRNARHAYFAAISYVDDQVGRLLEALAATGLDKNTIIIFTSDHGDMLGERGLWYKMTFFEWSARVPLLIHAPQHFGPHRVGESVSLVDLLPTLLDLTGAELESALAAPIAGHSLTPLMRGEAPVQPHTVVSEYLAEGVAAPALMIRRGPHKYVHAAPDTELLYTLGDDPDELNNLADQPHATALCDEFRAELQTHWDLAELRATVIASQRRRRLVDRAVRQGRYAAWDYQPVQDAAQLYMRNHLDLNELERRARFPAPPSLSPGDGI